MGEGNTFHGAGMHPLDTIGPRRHHDQDRLSQVPAESGALLGELTLLPGDDPVVGATRFADWLAARS